MVVTGKQFKPEGCLRGGIMADNVRDRGFITLNFLSIYIASCIFYGAYFYFMPVFPIVLQRAGYGGTESGIVVGAFSFTAIFLRPFVGTLVDRFQRKIFMLAGIGIFIIAPLLYITTSSLVLLTVYRLLHGLGLAAYTVSSLVTITEIVPRERLARAVAVYATCVSLAVGFGPTAGMKLAASAPFKLVVLIPSLAAVLAFILILRLPGSKVMAVREERQPFLAVLASRDVLFPSLIFASCSCTQGGVMAFLPLATAHLAGTGIASLFFLIFSLVIVFVRLTMGGLSDKVGRVMVIVPAVSLIALGMMGLSVFHAPALLIAVAVVYGLGYGLSYPTLNVYVVEHAPAASRGTALGIFSASVDTGYFLGPILAGLLSDLFSYRGAFFALAWLPLLTLLLFLYVLFRAYGRIPSGRPETGLRAGGHESMSPGD